MLAKMSPSAARVEEDVPGLAEHAGQLVDEVQDVAVDQALADRASGCCIRRTRGPAAGVSTVGSAACAAPARQRAAKAAARRFFTSVLPIVFDRAVDAPCGVILGPRMVRRNTADRGVAAPFRRPSLLDDYAVSMNRSMSTLVLPCPTTVDAVIGLLADAGYVGDRRLAHRPVPQPEAAAAAVPRGRAGRRQDRAGEGAGARARDARCCACSATRAWTSPRPRTSGTWRGR